MEESESCMECVSARVCVCVYVCVCECVSVCVCVCVRVRGAVRIMCLDQLVGLSAFCQERVKDI